MALTTQQTIEQLTMLSMDLEIDVETRVRCVDKAARLLREQAEGPVLLATQFFIADRYLPGAPICSLPAAAQLPCIGFGLTLDAALATATPAGSTAWFRGARSIMVTDKSKALSNREQLFIHEALQRKKALGSVKIRRLYLEGRYASALILAQKEGML